MNHGWGVLPFGVVPGETFRDHPEGVIAAASIIGLGVTGHTFFELAPGVAATAEISGPSTVSVVVESPPSVAATAQIGSPWTYVRIEDHPPAVSASAIFGTPIDDAISLLAPRAIFYGYTFDGTNLSIPIADLLRLTAAEADAVTGDWREILQAILSATEYHRNFQWSIQPRTYNAFKMDLLYRDRFERRFGITFHNDMGEPSVAPEP